MTVGDTLDGAFQVLKAAWPAGLIAVLLTSVVDDLLGWWLIQAFFDELSFLLPFEEAVPTFEEMVEVLSRQSGALFLLNLVTALLMLFAVLAVLVSVADRDAGRPAGLGAVLAGALRRLPGVAASLVVFVVATTVAVVGALLVAGGIHQAALAVVGLALIPFTLALMGVYAVTAAASVIEGRSGWSALRRAIRVVRARLGRTIGLVLLALIILVALVLGFGLVSFVFLPLGDGPFFVGSYLLGTIALVIALAVMAGLGAMLLLDASARLEGADLADRARDIGPDDAGRW